VHAAKLFSVHRPPPAETNLRNSSSGPDESGAENVECLIAARGARQFSGPRR
jgi:hypothetical protein